MRPALIALAACAALTLAACSSSAGDSVAPRKKGLPQATGSGPVAFSPVPSPTGTEQTRLLAGLRALDLPHRDDGDRLVDNARTTCSSIRNGSSTAALEKATVARFSYSDAPAVTTSTAQQVIRVVRTSFCS